MQTLEEFDEECPLTSSFCQLISTAEFDEQSVAYTEQALRELYKTMDQSPRLCERVVRKRKQREMEKASIASFIEAKFFSTVQGHLNRCNAMGSAELKQRLEQLKEEMQKVCSYSREAKCMRTSRSDQINSGNSSRCSSSSSFRSTNRHPLPPKAPCVLNSPTFSFQPLNSFSFSAAPPSQPLPGTFAGVLIAPATSLPSFTFSSDPSSHMNSIPSVSVLPAPSPSVVRVPDVASTEPLADPLLTNHSLSHFPPTTDSCIFSPSSLTTASMNVLAAVNPARVNPRPPSQSGDVTPSHIPLSFPFLAPVHPGQESLSSVAPTSHLCDSATSPLLTSLPAPSTCHQNAVTPSSAPSTCHQEAVMPSSAPSTCHQDALTICLKDDVPTSTAPSACHQDAVMPSSASSACHHVAVMPLSAQSLCHQDNVTPSVPPYNCHQDAVMPSAAPCTCDQDAVTASSAPPSCHQDAATPSACHEDDVPPSTTAYTCNQDRGTPSTCHQDARLPSTSHQDAVTPSTCHQDAVMPSVLTRPHIHPDVKTPVWVPILPPLHYDPGMPCTSSPDPASVSSVCAPPPAPPIPPPAPPLLFTPRQDQLISKQMLGTSVPDLAPSNGLGKLNNKSVLDQGPVTPLTGCSRDTISSLQSELRAGNHMYRLRKTGLVSLVDQGPITPPSGCSRNTISSLQSEPRAGHHMYRLRKDGPLSSAASHQLCGRPG